MIQDTSAQDVTYEKSKVSGINLKILLIFIAIAAVSWFIFPLLNRWLSSDISVNVDRVRVATVQKGEFTRDILLQGNVVAANSPKLYATAAGAVSLLVNPGDVVSKGDVVAIVESPTLTNQLQQEQAQLGRLAIEVERQKILNKQAVVKNKQQIELEKVLLDAAKREKRRAELSFKIKALSEIDFEKSVDELKRSELKYEFAKRTAELEVENLAFELKTREFSYNQYRLLVENTERQVRELQLLAPVSGIVGSWSVEQKSAVQVNQSILTIVDLSNFQVEVDIPEVYSDKLGIGLRTIISYQGKDYDAEVISISPEVKESIVKGRIAFVSIPPPGIKQNQRVTSRVILEHKNDVLFLPRGAFVQHHGGKRAFVVSNNRAVLSEIHLGSSSIDKIEVMTGLTEGQQVIISNTDFLNDAEQFVLN